jgi:type IV pilus assembly protein PilF
MSLTALPAWRRALSVPAIVALALLLAACVTTTAGRTTSAPSGTDAAQYNLSLGVGYLRQGNLQAAKDKLERAIEQDPGLATAHSALGLVYERLEDLDGAEQQYRRAAQLAPDDPDVQNALGVFLCSKRGKSAEALKVFDRALAIPLSRKNVNRAVLYTNAGTCAKYTDLPRAEAYLRRALAENPDYADALLQLAEVTLASGNGLAARAFLERNLAAAGPTPAGLLLGYRIESQLGDATAAARYAERLRGEFPTAAEIPILDGLRAGRPAP